MNKTYLNFNSVEDVPLLNSRAAFQVDSSAVFREQDDNLSVSFCYFEV